MAPPSRPRSLAASAVRARTPIPARGRRASAPTRGPAPPRPPRPTAPRPPGSSPRSSHPPLNLQPSGGGGGGGVIDFSDVDSGSGAKPRGLLRQIVDLPLGVPVGLGHMMASFAKSTVAVPHLAYDAARGDLPDSGLMGYLQRYAPLQTEIGGSFAHTGALMTNPGRAAAEFKQANEEGRSVDFIVEHGGNAAVALGAAGRALGGVRAGSIAASATEAPYLAGGRTAASAGAAATARTVPTAAASSTAAIGESVLPRLVPAVAETTVPVAYPKFSLANAFQKAGRPTAAARASSVGTRMRWVGSLGDQVADAPARVWTYLPEKAGNVMRAGGAGRYVPTTYVRSRIEQAGAEGGQGRIGRHLWRFSEEGRRYNAVDAEMNRGLVEADRLALVPGRIAKEAGLPDTHSTAAMSAVAHGDRRHHPRHLGG
jgi:hypothetical protein